MQDILQKCVAAQIILPLFYQPTASHWQGSIQFSVLNYFTTFYNVTTIMYITLQGIVSQIVVCVTLLAGQSLPTDSRS